MKCFVEVSLSGAGEYLQFCVNACGLNHAHRKACAVLADKRFDEILGESMYVSLRVMNNESSAWMPEYDNIQPVKGGKGEVKYIKKNKGISSYIVLL